MKLLLLSLLASTATAPLIDRDSPLPPPLAAAFKSADRAVHKIGVCLGDRAAYESVELDELDQKLTRLLGDAGMIWGGDDVLMQATVDQLNNAEIDVDCKSEDISTLFDGGKRAINSLEASLKNHLAAFDHGVWVGSVPLCGRALVKTEITKDEYADIDVLAVTLDGPVIAELSKLTKASVGHQLAIRVEGEVVVAPSINEPLLSGQFQISGPDKPELERIASLLSGCAASEPN